MLDGRILITGGAGFLGRAIMARAKREGWPARFTIFSRDEQKQDACRQKYPDAAYVLGDIRDTELLSAVMAYQDMVIHAAALKYIPESEFNVNEAIAVNIGGVQSVIAATRRSQVRTTCFVSTDKAVEPLNTYGFTKALGERLMYEASRMYPERRFVSVRYGNVIGSTGSVVPVFKRLARENGFIPITDPNMTRFWISYEEAIDLIVSAILAGTTTGNILIPSPRAMQIGDLASVLCPGVRQRIDGLRPGEKMHEKLLGVSETPKTHIVEYLGCRYYSYKQDNPVQAVPNFELSSENAAIMPADEFLMHVEAAEQI